MSQDLCWSLRQVRKRQEKQLNSNDKGKSIFLRLQTLRFRFILNSWLFIHMAWPVDCCFICQARKDARNIVSTQVECDWVVLVEITEQWIDFEERHSSGGLLRSLLRSNAELRRSREEERTLSSVLWFAADFVGASVARQETQIDHLLKAKTIDTLPALFSNQWRPLITINYYPPTKFSCWRRDCFCSCALEAASEYLIVAHARFIQQYQQLYSLSFDSDFGFDFDCRLHMS